MKRIESTELNKILGAEKVVLDKGFIRLVDYMGDDTSIVQSARVSYGRGTKKSLEDRNLIRFLMKHSHTTPFESCYMKLHIKCPIFVARQIFRHRTFSYNEYSARYSVVEDSFYIPSQDRLTTQSTENKQMSSIEKINQSDLVHNDIDMLSNECYESYINHMENHGLSRELARIQLPQNMYTEFYMGGTLHNWLRFCKLRSDPHAQYEVQEYSNIILNEILTLWTPIAVEAFNDYQINSVTLSKHEYEYIVSALKGNPNEELLLRLSKREANEFRKRWGL